MGQGVTLPTTSSVPAIPTRNGQSSKRRTMLNRLIHPTAQAVADPTDVLRVQEVRGVALDLTAYPAHVDGGSRRPQWRGRRRPGRRVWCAGRSPCSVPRALPCISRAPLPACGTGYRRFARQHPANIPGARGRQVGALFRDARCGHIACTISGRRLHPLVPKTQRAPLAQHLPARPPRTRCVYPSDKRPHPHASIRRRQERPGLRCPVALSQIAPNRDEDTPGHVVAKWAYFCCVSDSPTAQASSTRA